MVQDGHGLSAASIETSRNVMIEIDPPYVQGQLRWTSVYVWLVFPSDSDSTCTLYPTSTRVDACVLIRSYVHTICVCVHVHVYVYIHVS